MVPHLFEPLNNTFCQHLLPLRDSEIPDRRKTVVTLIVQSTDNYLLEVMSRFSSFIRLQRVFSWILRFRNQLHLRIHRSVKSPIRSEMTLSITELEHSRTTIIRLVQSYYYRTEIALLNKETIPPTLRSLAPFFDDLGLLRVGGRLRNASLKTNAKYPLLLPKKAWLSSLICD